MSEFDTYSCQRCGKMVALKAPGTKHRNHCPFCLWSLHVAQSLKQDDRSSECMGLMEPIAISTQRDGEWSLIHRCQKCGNIKANRIAGDDDSILLLSLAVRPLTVLPFPLDTLQLEAIAKYGRQPAD